MPDLFTPLRLGTLTLPNRVLMAPLTRCRADDHRSPTPLMAEHYRQRAGSGLIIAEATTISPHASGYPNTPGLYTDQHVRAWQHITNAVHAAGGRIACQLWHVGRISHPIYQPDGLPPLAPSPVHPGGQCRLPDGTRAPRTAPRAMTLDDIHHTINDYANAARRAMQAGFDAVELHAANGYLPQQFLHSGTNHRADHYGGSIDNRARFILQATQACIDACGNDRVGVRLSPSGISADNGHDSDHLATYTHVVKHLDQLNIAYLHIMHAPQGWTAIPNPIPVHTFRPLFRNALIANAGFDYTTATHAVTSGWCDAVAFGTLYIANPDLAERFRRCGPHAPLNTPDPQTYYSHGPAGYTDYPPLQDLQPPAAHPDTT